MIKIIIKGPQITLDLIITYSKTFSILLFHIVKFNNLLKLNLL